MSRKRPIGVIAEYGDQEINTTLLIKPETARERFYKAERCELCTLMVPRPSMAEHQTFYCMKRSKKHES
jgi:hypothetical protein